VVGYCEGGNEASEILEWLGNFYLTKRDSSALNYSVNWLVSQSASVLQSNIDLKPWT
jgi:hypothetical protein